MVDRVIIIIIILVYLFILAVPRGLRDLSSPPGIEPRPPAVEAQSPNHWTAREHPYFLFYFIFIGVQLIYNVVLVSGVQQSESVIHIHISTLFQILFPYRSLQRIEQSSLCYTVGPYQLPILYTVVCTVYVNPNLPIYPFSPLIPW